MITGLTSSPTSASLAAIQSGLQDGSYLSTSGPVTGLTSGVSTSATLASGGGPASAIATAQSAALASGSKATAAIGINKTAALVSGTSKSALTSTALTSGSTYTATSAGAAASAGTGVVCTFLGMAIGALIVYGVYVGVKAYIE